MCRSGISTFQTHCSHLHPTNVFLEAVFLFFELICPINHLPLEPGSEICFVYLVKVVDVRYWGIDFLVLLQRNPHPPPHHHITASKM